MEMNFDTHVSYLGPFIFNSSKVDLKEVAIHDSYEFVIGPVLEYGGDCTRRETTEFKVQWLGYSLECDSWEPNSLCEILINCLIICASIRSSL